MVLRAPCQYAGWPLRTSVTSRSFFSRACRFAAALLFSTAQETCFSVSSTPAKFGPYRAPSTSWRLSASPPVPGQQEINGREPQATSPQPVALGLAGSLRPFAALCLWPTGYRWISTSAKASARLTPAFLRRRCRHHRDGRRYFIGRNVTCRAASSALPIDASSRPVAIVSLTTTRMVWRRPCAGSIPFASALWPRPCSWPASVTRCRQGGRGCDSHASS